MRLGFHYHSPMRRRPDGSLSTPGPLGVFLDQLAASCEHLVCFQHSALETESPLMDYVIRAGNVTWVDIGPHHSIPHRTLLAGRSVRRIAAWRDRLDAMLIRGPSPLLAQVAAAAGPVPTALLIVGDYVESARGLVRRPFRKKLIQTWAAWTRRRQFEVARRSLTIVNSRHLYEILEPRLPILYETRTTTLSAVDHHTRPDTCAGRPVRLLYTGRMDRSKGLPEIIAALGKLNRRGIDAVLDLVGPTPPGDPIVDELLRAARTRGIGGRVEYHGYRTVGPDLFSFYKSADVYVIGSTTSEGFPRTVWEAMAHSLPVVATRVGSLPHFLEDGTSAVLVEPGDDEALANGIAAVVEDGDLRRRLIGTGYEIARENTLERRTEELLERIRWWVKTGKRGLR